MSAKPERTRPQAGKPKSERDPRHHLLHPDHSCLSTLFPFVLSPSVPFVLSPSKDQTAPAKPQRARRQAGEPKAERASLFRPLVPFVLTLSKHPVTPAETERIEVGAR